MTPLNDKIQHKNPVQIGRGTIPMRGLQKDINRAFNDFFGDLSLPSWDHVVGSVFAVSPAIDVSETDKTYDLTAELPGMVAKDVDVNLSEGYLTIKGEKKKESHCDGQGYFRQERAYGGFRRVIALPENADLDTAEASLKHGLLSIKIPKKVGAKKAERKLDILENA